MCLYVCVSIHKFLYLFAFLVIWLKSINMFHKSFLSDHLSVLIRKQPLSGGCFGGFCRVHRGMPVLGSPFLIVVGHRPVTLLTGRLWHRCFPVNLVGFLGRPFLQSTSGQLLLLIPFSYPFLGSPVLGSPFLIVAGHRPVTLLTGRLWHRCFPVNLVGFLGRPFLQSTSGRLLLLIPFSYPFLTLFYFS